MKAQEMLEKLLPLYKGYFDVTTEGVMPPFAAEAKFVSHGEQYFLVHAAKLADIDSKETIYFGTEETLSFEQLSEMSKKAWEKCIESVVPYYGHRNSDVSVIVITEKADEEVLKNCRKIKFSKSYKFMLYGWSNFKLVVVDLNSGKVVSNHFGAETKDYIKKFVKKCSDQEN